MFGGGYAIGYLFGPFPSLEDITGIKAVSGAPKYKGEYSLVRSRTFGRCVPEKKARPVLDRHCGSRAQASTALYLASCTLTSVVFIML
uniref:Uncharacterized protein n=1 Tax=Hyaloperonospora arabidopsidis (strain Emoy2) TaxID=559515 RepID=M4B7R9_HYAAE